MHFILMVAWLIPGASIGMLGYKLNGRSGLLSSVVAYVLSGLTMAALIAMANQSLIYKAPF